MDIHIFHCTNDYSLSNYGLFSHPKIQSNDLRAIHDTQHIDTAIVLLSFHSTNHRTIRYIRTGNILTPIYVVSTFPIYYKEMNGVIHPSMLTYNTLVSLIEYFPQRSVWGYAFEHDKKQRDQLNPQPTVIN